MNSSILIFNLTGGLTDMKKNLISINIFCENNNFYFTIKYCSAKPQDSNFSNLIPDNIKKNNYQYDVKELFDEETFLIYKNYIPYENIENEVSDSNTFNFLSIHNVNSIFQDKDRRNFLIENHKEIIYNAAKDFKFIYIGNHFYFISSIDVNSYLYSIEFNKSVIPNKKILNEFNKFINEVKYPYNFIHYRYEEDMVKYVNSVSEFKVILLNDILESNLFKNNNLPIYIATSDIENLYKNKMISKKIEEYDNIFYNKNKFVYFNENAVFDFMVGLNAIEIFGFRKSGFSIVLNNLKDTKNYYDKIL
jgi:hypothetical protein